MGEMAPLAITKKGRARGRIRIGPGNGTKDFMSIFPPIRSVPKPRTETIFIRARARAREGDDVRGFCRIEPVNTVHGLVD